MNETGPPSWRQGTVGYATLTHDVTLRHTPLGWLTHYPHAPRPSHLLILLINILHLQAYIEAQIFYQYTDTFDSIDADGREISDFGLEVMASYGRKVTAVHGSRTASRTLPKIDDKIHCLR